LSIARKKLVSKFAVKFNLYRYILDKFQLDPVSACYTLSLAGLYKLESSCDPEL
jgi:hypothetical protein